MSVLKKKLGKQACSVYICVGVGVGVGVCLHFRICAYIFYSQRVNDKKNLVN